MYFLTSAGIILLLFAKTQSQEECVNVCVKAQTSEKAQAACKEGCRLQVILSFASGSDVTSVREECYNACAKSYSDVEEKQSCSFGCDNQPDMKKSKIRISVTDESPIFDVARRALEKMMQRISSSFTSLGEFDSSPEEHVEQILGDPFSQFHFRMQNEMARFHQIAQNLLNLQRAENIMPIIAKNRPEGHEENAMEGLSVGNNDKNGEKIMEVMPVESKDKEQRILGYENENPTIVEVSDSSLLTRLASRARRLSVLSQWLVCVALFLCFVSMVSISVAILKQIKSQKYLNLRNVHSIVPPTFTMAAKKVPLESTAVVTDYPLIHDSPPPAYDQLSVHKEKSENSADHPDPKV